LFNRVILENNGLRNEDITLLMRALQDLADFKSVICIRNEFGMSSVLELMPIFSRPLPQQLEELKLVSCPKLCQSTINKLLDSLIEKSFIRSLALVDAGINEDVTVKKLIALLSSSRYL
jgi:hypothetical protein